MRDFYEVLGVNRSADEKEIKRAYRRLAHEYHPDKNPDDKRAEERFKEATIAYDVLSDAEKRRMYDRTGANGWNGGSASSTGIDFEEAARNVGEVFGEIFGDFFRGHRRKTKHTRKERGRDRTLELRIDFETSIKGGERVLDVQRTEKCTVCAGTGARPGSSPHLCHACGGSGGVKVQQGLFSVSKECTYCKGRGRIVVDPCSACEGRGTQSRATKLRVKVPPASKSGTTLRYAGEGESGRNGGAPGDLRVILNVDDHSLFRREGDDIHVEMPISIYTAALGGQVEVPTLWGKVTMKLPPGTQPGNVFRLREKGAAKSETRKGDQHVTVRVEVPNRLTDLQRHTLESLRDSSAPGVFPKVSAFEDKLEGQ